MISDADKGKMLCRAKEIASGKPALQYVGIIDERSYFL